MATRMVAIEMEPMTEAEIAAMNAAVAHEVVQHTHSRQPEQDALLVVAQQFRLVR